jgi:uncharacterized RDD family membrane protein YckC
MSILGLSITETRPVIAGAGFWIRVLVRVVDIMYGYGLGLVAGFVGGMTLAILQAMSIADAGWVGRVSRAKMTLFITSLVGNLLYHTICEGVDGATLGKRVCSLRVLSERLTACGLRPAFIRSLAYFLDAIAFGAVGYLEMQKTLMEQRHGDRWAKTIVVRRRQVPEQARRPPGRFWMALALGSVAWGLLLTAALVWTALAE